MENNLIIGGIYNVEQRNKYNTYFILLKQTNEVRIFLSLANCTYCEDINNQNEVVNIIQECIDRVGFRPYDFIDYYHLDKNRILGYLGQIPDGMLEALKEIAKEKCPWMFNEN